MKRMVFSSVFEADFAEITAQLAAEAAPEVSLRWENAVIRLVGLLRKHPELGRVRRDLHPAGIRTFGVKEFPNFLLFYRTTASEIIFLRVRFGGMDLAKMFPADLKFMKHVIQTCLFAIPQSSCSHGFTPGPCR